MPEIDYSQRSILIIEHSELYRGIIKKILMEIGANDIRVASTGKEAILACEDATFDTVLCDFSLGKGKSGLQVLEQLRINQLIKPSCVFVMITATVDKNIVFSCLEHKPNVFITKPFTHNDLKGRLDRAYAQQDSLKPIMAAMDENDYKSALVYCEMELQSNSRYQAWCLKTKCELLYKLESYDECIASCQSALKIKDHTWAHLVIAKTHCALKQPKLALEIYTALYSKAAVSVDGIEALDDAAQIHLDKGEYEQAQKLLQQACDLSGLSVPRLRALADVCEENDDVEAATKAHRNVAKYGEYSMHSCADNNLDFARILSECAVRVGDVESKILIAEALTAINKVNKIYTDKSTKVRSTLLASQAFSSIEENTKADQLLGKAVTGYQELNSFEKSADVKVELVRTYVMTGHQDEAKALINEMSEGEPLSQKLAARIDRISEEPVSPSGKNEVVKINSKGIKFYNAKEFKKAIVYFNKALKRFPKHIGIRLNLAQAIIGQLTLQGPDKTLVQQCLDDLAHLSHLTTIHGQYHRLTELSDKINDFKSQCEAT